jgi:hypothetical protein
MRVMDPLQLFFVDIDLRIFTFIIVFAVVVVQVGVDNDVNGRRREPQSARPSSKVWIFPPMAFSRSRD